MHPLKQNAEIAQLVEHNLAKVRVASSSLVFRSFYEMIAITYAQVAELVDAHVSGACVERHAGSSPVLGTLFVKRASFAEIAQLVEHNLAKVRVASSSLVFRSSLKGCSNGGIGRHEGLKIPWPLRLCGFKSRFEYWIKAL